MLSVLEIDCLLFAQRRDIAGCYSDLDLKRVPLRVTGDSVRE